jgi:hypothetical protein
VAVVVVLVVGFVAIALLDNPAGKVFFSTTVYDSASSTCAFPSAITSASSTDPIYVVADLNDTLAANDSVSMEVFKDGVSQGTQDMTQTSQVNCIWITNNIGPLQTGTWKVVFTHNGKVEAEGTITIK